MSFSWGHNKRSTQGALLIQPFNFKSALRRWDLIAFATDDRTEYKKENRVANSNRVFKNKEGFLKDVI